MEYRTEHDSMGEVQVPVDRYWGAQTQRSHENFPIGVGIETMPAEIIHAFGILKKAGRHLPGLRRGHQRPAERPLSPGGVADRLRHPVQYERQRGHC